MTGERAGRAATAASALMKRAGRAYRTAVTAGRWVVVAFWVAAAALITVLVPGHGGGGDFGALLPPDSKVLKVEERVLELFRVPVLFGTTVVVHQPEGLSLLTRADSLLWALGTTQKTLEADEPPPPGTVAAAIPLPTGRADTTVTYLFMSEGTDLFATVRAASQYRAHFNNQPEVESYVTGFLPAQMAQATYLSSRLRVFEIASVVLILVVVAMAFRSLLAPVVVLGVAAVGYLVYFPMLGQIAALLGFAVPNDLQPVLLALLLGVVTDYCVLFFAAFRDELRAGAGVRAGAERAIQLNASVVAVAGLTVAAGTLALLAAPFAIFRGLGPALALTVLVGMAICLTLAPAVMTILGWRLFTVLPTRSSPPARGGSDLNQQQHDAPRLTRLMTILTRRWPALGATAAVVVLLALASLPLTQARLDLSFTAALPRDDGVSRGAQLLDTTGLRGITAPVEVLVEQPGVARDRLALLRLQQGIGQQPGVARVVGPASLPATDPQGVVLAQNGDAARYIVVFDSDPLATRAVQDTRALEDRLPELARTAGLGEAELAMTGQTLIAGEVADLTRESLQITVVVALLLELLILTLYLRAAVTPLVLLACSTLSVTAALGLTTLLFQGVLGYQGLTFYAPFAATVLLIALGADYIVFSVGSIWNEARRRPLREALVVAVPRSSHAITTAGAILAATFAIVAIIPLATFYQIAFAMTVGLLLDTFVVRPVLTPAVLTLLGRWATWPHRQLRSDEPPATAQAVGPEAPGAG